MYPYTFGRGKNLDAKAQLPVAIREKRLWPVNSTDEVFSRMATGSCATANFFNLEVTQ